MCAPPPTHTHTHTHTPHAHTSAPPPPPRSRSLLARRFLSHIWGSGQDQCATIKRQLCLLMPGVSIFLDVDDLESIDKLEEYVDATAVIMIFVSKGYFGSKNCLREAVCTVNKQKRITLVHDSAVYLKSLRRLRRSRTSWTARGEHRSW